MKSDKFDESIFDDIANTKVKKLKLKKKLSKNEKFFKYFISKFSKIKSGSRLILERMKNLIVGENLLLKERELFKKMLYCRKTIIAWKLFEIRKTFKNISFSVKNNIISHKIWQILSFMIPRALIETIIKMLQKRLNREILKSCHESYRNSWFLIKKKQKNIE